MAERIAALVRLVESPRYKNGRGAAGLTLCFSTSTDVELPDSSPKARTKAPQTTRLGASQSDPPSAAAVPRAHPLDQRHTTVFVERVDRFPEGRSVCSTASIHVTVMTTRRDDYGIYDPRWNDDPRDRDEDRRERDRDR